MKTDYEIRQETEKDYPQVFKLVEEAFRDMEESDHCLLYTSDAADE